MSMSSKQLKQLGIAATAAAKHQRAIGALSAATLPPDMRTASKTAQNEFWRHQQVALATQRVCSFNDMVQDEYCPVMQHFEALAGPDHQARAVESTVRVVESAACHRAPGCEYVRQMEEWMEAAGYKPGYMVVIMKGKFGGITDIRRLNDRQLKQLHDTIVNRARAKLGQGDAANRNKKQTRERVLGKPVNDTPAPTAKPLAPSPPQAGAGAAPSAPRSRDYILRPRDAAKRVDPGNIPF